MSVYLCSIKQPSASLCHIALCRGEVVTLMPPQATSPGRDLFVLDSYKTAPVEGARCPSVWHEGGCVALRVVSMSRIACKE